MAKSKHPKAAKPETLREQIKRAVKDAGFTPAERSGQIGAKKIGDGAFLGKFLKLAELLGPLLGPLLGLKGEPAAQATAEDGDAEFVNELRNAVSACGLTHDEMTATASATGLFGVAEKWLKFAMLILPFLNEQFTGEAPEPASQSQAATEAAPEAGDEDGDEK